METNNVSDQKKDSIMKSLAIAGLVGILLLVAWLAIQLVHLFPGAVTSLASLAEGVNQYQETIIDTNPDLGELTLTSNTSLLNTGEDVTIAWSEVNARGSFTFTYDCIDGVAVDQVTDTGLRPIDCGTNYNLGDSNNITLSIESEKNRYADVPYTVAFLRTSDTQPIAAGSNSVTLVNTDINNQFTFGEIEETPTVSEEIIEEVPAETETPATNPTTPAAPPAPTFTQEFVYTIPVSDPDGFTDLGVSYVGVGEVINNSFVPGIVSTQNDGAIQFVVKNFGTKTSRDWTFSIELPNGDTYESPTQDELKPNERAVLTIGFPAGDESLHTFEVEIEESTDRNSRNDSFDQTVAFAR